MYSDLSIQTFGNFILVSYLELRSVLWNILYILLLFQTHDSSLLGTVQSAYPLGVPVLEVKSSVCALPGIQFTLLYSHKYKMPMLASYTLNPSKVSSWLVGWLFWV